jgi:excisionase family DNA binding protein
MFGVDRRTVLNWARKGRLSSQRTAGGHRRYRESDVRSLLAELEAVA